MEEKIMNILSQILDRLDNMESDVKGLNQSQERIENRLDNIENDVKDLKQGQAKTEERLTHIEAKVDTIDNKLDNMEAQNASRHVELNGKIDSLSKDVAFLEAATGKNMTDIATLKLVK